MRTIALIAALLLQAQADEKQIMSLIEQLGSDRVEIRDKATAELVQLGKAALPHLKRALKADDPEIRGRIIAAEDLDLNSVEESVVIGLGKVRINAAKRAVIIAKGQLEITHAVSCTIVCAAKVQCNHFKQSAILALGGARGGISEGCVYINTASRQIDVPQNDRDVKASRLPGGGN
ncbi:MAG: hypothetical protein ACRD1B_00365 [Thermoanaerobaculia bacterium]